MGAPEGLSERRYLDQANAMVRLLPLHERQPLPNLLGNNRQPQVSEKPKARGLAESKDAKCAAVANGLPDPRPMSEAEHDLMRAVCGQDVQKAKELLRAHGPSLLSGRGGGGVTSTAILYAAESGQEE